MLLRHSNSKVKALRAAGASLDDYTFVQPTSSICDYLADGQPEIKVVAVIVVNYVDGVYRVNGVKELGTTRSLVSAQFREFDIRQGYPEKPAKRFQMVEVQSSHEG